MSEKKHRDGDNTAISASTLDIDDFEPLSDGQSRRPSGLRKTIS